ncbi:MAG: cytochrome c biogenesis protein CcsA [Gammaproteobacteria bacterium]|nr:cytochrome c biogenesis protein CcsA [Gammaproteobacteria bacterium]MBU2677278.1 cytochrome c biogenesis protein CcsA [Gammaproteobacteria bacterium]NNC56003.1 cytochrome c biogenesis protein CcsA [Woeseiaceae bacterium]NNL51009.1 cytochrome c biogenesis protein CcsA [Woeseiaceae bacterium]
MSQITIFLLYLIAAVGIAISRLPRFAEQARPYFLAASICAVIAVVLHAQHLFSLILPQHGLDLSIGSAASMIGLELALIALLAAIEPTLRGMSAGMLVLSAATAMLMGTAGDSSAGVALTWQVRAHVLIALLSYGLLTVGAIVSLFAMIQERRLQSARITPANQLFAPLETTEKLLIGVTAAGFAGLTLAIATGLSFVNDLVEQHLAHKFGLSLLAWVVFGTLLAGRFVAGWRGKRAVKLYLWGFATLCLAYFGSRFILEEILHRSWG